MFGRSIIVYSKTSNFFVMLLCLFVMGFFCFVPRIWLFVLSVILSCRCDV